MKATTIMVPLILAAAAAAAAQQVPPAETLQRLAAASKLIETWPGTYVVTTRATISRTDGSKPESNESVMRMSGGEGGPRVVEVVSATQDGKDVTAKTRADVTKAQARQEREREKKRSGDKDDDSEVSLDLPGADNTAKFVFTPRSAGAAGCGATFTPAPARTGEPGLTTGELEWDCATLDPRRLTARPAVNPKHVSEMSLRIEFARSGDSLYVSHTVTDGVGGILFIKRRFHVETEVSELRPAASETGAAAKVP